MRGRTATQNRKKSKGSGQLTTRIHIRIPGEPGNEATVYMFHHFMRQVCIAAITIMNQNQVSASTVCMTIV